MAGVPTNEELTLGRKFKNFVFSTEWITATIAGTRFLPPSIPAAVDPTVSIDYGVCLKINRIKKGLSLGFGKGSPDHQ